MRFTSRKVDFPQPDGPINAVTRLCGTSRSMLWRLKGRHHLLKSRTGERVRRASLRRAENAIRATLASDEFFASGADSDCFCGCLCSPALHWSGLRVGFDGGGLIRHGIDPVGCV